MPQRIRVTATAWARARRSTLKPVLPFLVLLLSGALSLALALPSSAQGEASFRDATDELGVTFVHRHFGTGKKYMPENMGAGVALADLNGDGRLDLYFVQGAPLPESADPPESAGNQLYLQKSDGTFTNATSSSGADHRGVGMGVTWADLERDGDLDLFITNYGANALLRNLGDGTFEDVTESYGVGDKSWGASAGFFDADSDGDLDLFVTNYLAADLGEHTWCGNAQSKIRSYCHPDIYAGQPDLLYRATATSLREVSAEAGIDQGSDGKGLGLGLLDLDGDRLPEVFVANDSVANHTYTSAFTTTLRYRETALEQGLAVNGSGAPEASMGVLQADFTGDGKAEIFLTHLDQETNTLYRQIAPGLYLDATAAAGLANPSLPWVGFGAEAIDFDNDGDLDLLVANGHIIDNVQEFHPERSHKQPLQLFENDGQGRFRDASAKLGTQPPLVARGTVQGDIDGDGDLDVVITQNDGPARVLLNEGATGRACSVRLQGTESNVHGWGAKLVATVANRQLVRWATGASGYLSHGSPSVWFGLADATQIDRLEVTWPSGTVDLFGPLQAGSHRLVEGTSPAQQN